MLSQWVGKTFHFDAAHSIPGHEKCGVVHGHTWKVTVEVKNEVKCGMVLDLHLLSEVVEDILKPFDHAYLNGVVLFAPTCENLADYFVSRIYVLFADRRIPLPARVRVKVQEGEGGWSVAEE